MRRRCVPLLVWLALVAAGCLRAAPDEPLPDIVVILADDLGWGDLGCYGAERIATPVLDGIAERGVRFTDAHAPSAVCSPSRFGMLTGTYPWRSGVVSHLAPDDPVVADFGPFPLPELLRGAGYATACIGKWHLGLGTEEDPGNPASGPLDIGFERYFGAQVRWRGHPRCWISDREWVGWRDGEVVPLAPGEERTPLAAIDPDEMPLALLDETRDFLEAAGDRPVFLWFATFHVHLPHIPGRRFLGSSEAGRYGDYVQELDWLAGELLGLLEETGRRRRAVLFVTSDNGGAELGEREGRGHRPNGPWRGAKPQVWEGGHRVPFLVEWAGRVPPGTVTDETVSLVDLYATIAEIADAPIPEGAAADSRSLLSELGGRSAEAPEREGIVMVSLGGKDRAVRRGPWKLVLLRDGSRELYDLSRDPGEQHDRAVEHPELVEELAGVLERIEAGPPTAPR